MTDGLNDAAALRIVDNAERAAQVILDGPYADLREAFVRNIAAALRAAHEWREAIIDACVVNHLGWDEGDPRRTLRDLIAWQLRLALDPAVSEAANALHEKGRQAGIKQATKIASDWISTTFPLHEPVDWETHEQIGRDIAVGIADAIRALSSL